MMVYEEIRLHPTFLSLMVEAEPEAIVSETAQARAVATYMRDGVASHIKEGRLHLWFETGVSVERLGWVVGSGLAALLPERERGSTDAYGDIAAKTAVFLNRVEKAGRL